MLDKTKTDEILGYSVNQYLTEKGVQTPMLDDCGDETSLTDKDKRKLISDNIKSIMTVLNLDLNDDSLKDTPNRVAKMFVNEIYWGLDYKNFPKCKTVENKMNYNEMVLEKDVKVMSQCEHHLVLISGLAQIAYLPKDKVIGLSKLNRIVEYFSRRPQIQERLTEQIFYALEYILGTSDIAVIINAEHYCVKSRGVEDINSSTFTSKLGGKFMSQASLRSELMSLIK